MYAAQGHPELWSRLRTPSWSFQEPAEQPRAGPTRRTLGPGHRLRSRTPARTFSSPGTPFCQGQARAALSQAQGFVGDSFRSSVTMTRGSGGEIHPGSSRRDERPGPASVALMASGKGRQTETERADDRKTRPGEG